MSNGSCKVSVVSEDVNVKDGKEKALLISEGLAGTELYRGMVEVDPGAPTPFRISPEPFFIDQQTLDQIEALGPHLLRFYQAANRLYLQSVRGSAPGWVRDYLERGKSETVIEYQRMRRFRTALPAIIRPDIIPTDQGLIISELDSVPGGFGLLAALSRQYASLGYGVVGGEDGIPQGFWEAITQGLEHPDPLAAIVVSDESDSYRGELTWLSERLVQLGHRAVTLHPRDLLFSEEGLFAPPSAGQNGLARNAQKIDVLYRFFELFDLKNIPKIDLILYAIRKEMVRATPPIKSHLEEKLLFALLHHGQLRSFWKGQMGQESLNACETVFPMTWVMDPRPVPPHATIPGLNIAGAPIRDFKQLSDATQRERELVIKPSGYSPEAWGSRGVLIGHDVSASDWSDGIDKALEAFEQTPHVLQRFHKGAKFDVSYYDFAQGIVRKQPSRVRLCPYYFVVGDQTKLGGILATCTPIDKKIIHGMSEAIMMPVAIKPSREETH